MEHITIRKDFFPTSQLGSELRIDNRGGEVG
jgi:hypothetical protein